MHRSIVSYTLCLIAAMALTRLCVYTYSSDKSLLVDGISTNISDIMRKRDSKINDEFNASMRNKNAVTGQSNAA